MQTVTQPVEYSHPLFRTPVTVSPTAAAAARPAIKVDVLDASETPYLTTAELYLSVQSSRFPGDLRLLLPINQGEFAGAGVRFVELPFEVREGDMLALDLLDEDALNASEQQALLLACRGAGYCLVTAGAVYQPKAAMIVAPNLDVAAESLATAIAAQCDLHAFESYGTAEYIVPASLPRQVQQANRLTISDAGLNARVDVRIYAPLLGEEPTAVGAAEVL